MAFKLSEIVREQSGQPDKYVLDSDGQKAVKG